MRIAVNAASFSNHVFEMFLKLSASKPEHKFLFIFDKPFSNNINFSENIVPIVVERNGNSRIKWKFWYKFKIPIALKKHNSDVFISEKSISLRTKIPELLLFPDFTFIYQPSLLEKKWVYFYKKNLPLFLIKASQIAVSSDYLKKEIIRRYQIKDEKIKIVHPEIENDFRQLTFEEKEFIKEKYAEGNEYFIHSGTISPEQNLLILLKAFSFFKKRQKSKMQLLIAGTAGLRFEEFAQSLQHFRFKDEVKILKNLQGSEKEKVIAAAYAMIHVPVYESDSAQALEEIKYKVPAIISSTGALPELFGDAALYAYPEDFKDIAEKMMLLFKDEKLRKDLIEKESVQIEKYSRKKNNETLFRIIEDIVNNLPSSNKFQ
jgi:glycosyltransferase involved in cell wall biosynthesis